MRRETAEKRLTASMDRHLDRAEEALEAVVLSELKAWHRRFPRRRVRFTDAMGVVIVEIDDREVDDIHFLSAKGSLNAAQRRSALVQPLVDLADWYRRISDDHCMVCISEIVLEPTGAALQPDLIVEKF